MVYTALPYWQHKRKQPFRFLSTIKEDLFCKLSNPGKPNTTTVTKGVFSEYKKEREKIQG